MKRFHQLLFVVSFVALSWLGMMAIHELGHIVGAMVTGGQVQQVVLHPLTISRTDVAPNPHPGLVVWAGPVAGCVLPLVAVAVVPRRHVVLCNVVRFYAGFCLIANGAYISVGSFQGVGDCGEMLRAGTPLWAMLAFGVATIAGGLRLWHGLGSTKYFLDHPTVVTPRMAYVTAGVLVTLVAVEFLLSPR